ncbi:pollen receptor-like kinase 5 [Tasmannia lanceolata]|uniref:pollen receptor-like kinase 5 n=1 Tax=Tasmannia lanceolata TaxID=3420 RepID=UPI0040634AF7
MAGNGPSRTLALFLILIYFFCAISFNIARAVNSDMLLKFKDSLENSDALSDWKSGSNPCPPYVNKGWIGLLCKNGTLWGLQLENMTLTGLVDIDSLVGLPDLRTLSLKNNSFEGPMPEIGKLGALKSVFLSLNKFSGEIPANEFSGMKSLKKLDLSKNEFSGRIPNSLALLPRLFDVRLEENNFTDKIPDFGQQGLIVVNVSYNQLDGLIPDGLRKMDAGFFQGNKDLCGEPLNIICKSSKKQSTALLIVIILIAIAVASAIIGAAFIFFRRCRWDSSKSDEVSSTKKRVAAYEEDQLEHGSPENVSAEKKGAGKDHDLGRLVFVRDDKERFDLQDLLRASAEVLGSGSFGSSYMAVLLSGPSIVVKRFREMNGVGKEEFQEHMRRLGRLRHPNLLPLVAFYYRKEERLLVSEFVENGSLMQRLHGNRSPNRSSLDWPTRLKIVKGVARGLAYLYDELPMLSLPHGHLKSSNVLLDESFEPLLTDYNLVPVMNKEHARKLMVAYKSPEYAQYGRTTKKSDVWSLGILILEILTGKSPANYIQQGRGSGTDLVSWVHSVVREEWTIEVFDSEMRATKDGEGEMLKLLQIGLCCCEGEVEKRWDVRKALERIEELRETEDGSSDASEGDMYSSRGMTDREDEFSFSINN